MESSEDYVSKEQVIDSVPKRIKALQFGLLSPEDIVSQSVLAITDRNIFDYTTTPGQKRNLQKHGPNDERLGTSSKNSTCETCGRGLKDCNGHFGHVKLALPAFHYGYLKKIIEVLSCVCKDCSRILLPEEDRRAGLRQVRRKGLDSLRKATVCKKLATDCKKIKVCPRCEGYNGPVKKVTGHPVKMIHNKWAIFTSSNAKNKKKPQAMQEWDKTFNEALKAPGELSRNIAKATDDMHPLRVLNIFRKIPDMDVELLGMDPYNGGRPENMLWTHVPAPPVAIRPSVAQEQASTEDDITNKLGDIIYTNNILKLALTRGQPLNKVMEIWEFVQVQIAMYIDGNLPGLGRDSQFGRVMRGFCQRLKGKQGRFRGNLSGKRVDFSGRTVISPDPNLGIDEVAVPSRVAVNMTYPEKVSKYNIEKLKRCVERGPNVHPGANFITKGNDGRRIVLRVMRNKGDLHKASRMLEIGDTVERHLEDGDIVLFNRQPSLHKLSILSHRVKVRPWRTFRLNECVCNPYNADFDGDEMNLHVPQTEEARTEALELMGVKNNLATPKDGTPIIAAIQDFITGAYLISQKDRFFNRREFMQIVSHMYDGMEVTDPYTGEKAKVEIPAPAIWKPQRLWTGKQIWNVLMRPHHSYPVEVNLEGKGKTFVAAKELPVQYQKENATEYRSDDQGQRIPAGAGGVPADDMSANDSYLVIRNSEVMCGYMDKATIGDGKKTSVFYVIMRDFGPDYAVAAMNRLAKLSARWLTEQGFSIGIGDVYPSQLLRDRKDDLVKVAYEKCIALIEKFNRGELERSPGSDEEQTLEHEISGILSAVRQDCGKACFAELSRFNAPLTMAKCGSKGSDLNVSQMVAAVGQQIIGGARVIDGFENRTLPHFPKASRDPPAKGFVVNSFFSGLNPTEFIFHAMSGREGLVDTAVKTAETGYMSRRLMKSLEDLSAQYDQTVRNSNGGVVQMRFGDDGLDPVDMEGNAKPVSFERTFMHSVVSTWDNADPGLLPDQIEEVVRDTLASDKVKLTRRGKSGGILDYNDPSDESIDQLESVRNFLAEIETFIKQRTSEMVSNQSSYNKDVNVGKIFKLSRPALDRFLYFCMKKFEKSKVEAGHAVGAVGAQSIGEPGTQMTLKTFHFAGVAGMSITQGVPRIKEIINASRNISTPVITCVLVDRSEEIAARMVKAVIQKTYLKDIIRFVDDVWTPDGGAIHVRIDWRQIEKMGLRISMVEILNAIVSQKGFTSNGGIARAIARNYLEIVVDPSEPDTGKGKRKSTAKKLRFDGEPEKQAEHVFNMLQNLKRKLPDLVIKGFPGAVRAIMQKEDKRDAAGREPINVLVEGTGLRQCMNTPGIDGTKTATNNVMETKDVLGIEAARSTIINEISAVMKGMDIDPRHMQLLADVMTYKGDVLGITRFGLAKMRDSVLQLASFEKTPDHLFEAAVGRKRDGIEGVSECIILGRSVGLGTGSMSVVRPLNVLARESGKIGGGCKRGGRGMKGLVREMKQGRLGGEVEAAA